MAGRPEAGGSRWGARRLPAILVGAIGAVSAMAGPCEADAQAARGGAAWLGTAETGGAALRGLPALGANPALLAHAPSSGVVFLLAGAGGAGLDPVGLGEVGRLQGHEVPEETREAWLQRVTDAGRAAGRMEARAGPLGVRWGPMAFQASVAVTGRARMDEEAAELLLFGNAGRKGHARELEPQEASLTGATFTTLSAGAGRVVREGDGPGPLEGGTLSVGAGLHLVLGHRFAAGRDRGTAARSDPARVHFRFGMVDRDRRAGRTGGRGVGVDLGVAWESPHTTWSVALRNAVNTFEWDPDRLRYRPGAVQYEEGGGTSDFQPQPFSQAPESVQRGVARLGFPREISVAMARRLDPRTRLMASARSRGDGALGSGPDRAAGLGVEFRFRAEAPLRAGAAWISGGYQLAAGAGYEVGPATLDAGASLRSQDGIRLPMAAAQVLVRLPDR